MEDGFILCSMCEESYRCPDALLKDGCDLGLQTPNVDELSEKLLNESQLLVHILDHHL